MIARRGRGRPTLLDLVQSLTFARFLAVAPRPPRPGQEHPELPDPQDIPLDLALWALGETPVGNVSVLTMPTHELDQGFDLAAVPGAAA